MEQEYASIADSDVEAALRKQEEYYRYATQQANNAIPVQSDYEERHVNVMMAENEGYVIMVGVSGYKDGHHFHRNECYTVRSSYEWDSVLRKAYGKD